MQEVLYDHSSGASRDGLAPLTNERRSDLQALLAARVVFLRRVVARPRTRRDQCSPAPAPDLVLEARIAALDDDVLQALAHPLEHHVLEHHVGENRA